MNELLRSRSAGIVFVAIAAALWGMDAWIRQPLAQTTDVATIVFGEHLVLVLCTLPFAGRRARPQCSGSAGVTSSRRS